MFTSPRREQTFSFVTTSKCTFRQQAPVFLLKPHKILFMVTRLMINQDWFRPKIGARENPLSKSAK